MTSYQVVWAAEDDSGEPGFIILRLVGERVANEIEARKITIQAAEHGPPADITKDGVNPELVIIEDDVPSQESSSTVH